MPIAFVLEINDMIVGPCLELIRRVCDPDSTSKPHITVRYVDKLEKNDLEAYRSTIISDIDFMEPGGFGLFDDVKQTNRTVFVKCASETLEMLSHKPHYPDSVFHVTLYDGKSLEFARALLRVLEEFEWRFRAPLSENTFLTKIEIKGRRKKTTNIQQEFNAEQKKLFCDITALDLNAQYLTTLSPERRLDIARLICAHLHKATAHFPRTPKPMNSQSATNGEYIERLEQTNGVDAASLIPELSKKWTGDINRDTANQAGWFLTPPELARDIVEYAISQLGSPLPQVHFGDPAAGTGVFFSALCQILPRGNIASAIGIELDHKRAFATHERWAHRGLEIIRGDYLHMDLLPPRTLVLANPPYVRYQHLEPLYGQKLRQRASVNMGMQINGQSGLYVYFLLLSHAWMAQDAVAAWLIPSEFMETKYGAAIRHYLTQKVQLIRVHRFCPNDAQFENALVSSAVVVFRNRLPVMSQTASLSIGGTLKNPKYIEEVIIDELRQENRWAIPRNIHSSESPSGPRLGDLFTVCRGIATGANDFFIMERTVAASKGIPENALRPVLPKARTLNNDIIERDKDGYPNVSPQLCLLDCGEQEENIRDKFPRLMEYLQTADSDVMNSTLVKRRKPWYRQERRNPPPFLCTYMGRGGKNSLPIRFIWNKSDAIATNVYLMLYPREKLAELLSKKPEHQADIFALLQETASRGLSDYGRVYGGGLRKIEPRELLEVRLAYLPTWLEEVIDMELF